VALDFGMARWRPERGRVTGAGLPWHFTVARPPAMTRHAEASHCDMVLRLGTWHPSGRWPTPARLSGPAVRQVGTVARAEQYPKLIPTARFSPYIVICNSLSTNHNGSDDHGVGSPAAIH
jgi:hypothetical protein